MTFGLRFGTKLIERQRRSVARPLDVAGALGEASHLRDRPGAVSAHDADVDLLMGSGIALDERAPIAASRAARQEGKPVARR